MQIGIVWLPNVGKSTLFNALTKNYSADAQNFPFCTIEPNVGIVNVNDPRLEQIRKVIWWEKIVPATTEFIDIAWIVEWASKWEWLWNKFLANIRQADAILQVVRVFEDDDIIHVNWKVDPKFDIEVINAELIMADIETVEKRLASDRKKAKSDKKMQIIIKTYEKILEWLNQWKIVSNMWLNQEELESISDLHLLTNKQFVYACNVSEDMMDTPEEKLQIILWLDKNQTVIPICAKLEADMVEMTNDEKNEFLTEMWLKTTWLDDLIKASYEALWLMYYFTAWVKEVRAWTIKKWWTAPQAAWVIHTDFEKWFIKADKVNWKDLVENGWWAWAREAWKVSLEWKEYVVADWDVLLFKFNN